jgi:hypothetical protein
LGKLLAVVTGAAVVAAILSAASRRFIFGVAGMGLAFVAIVAAPLCMGTLAVYCRGRRQTFFLGALVGSLAPLMLVRGVGTHNLSWDWDEWLMLLAVGLLTTAACGAMALGTRRLAERVGWAPPPNPSKPDSAD